MRWTVSSGICGNSHCNSGPRMREDRVKESVSPEAEKSVPSRPGPAASISEKPGVCARQIKTGFSAGGNQNMIGFASGGLFGTE